MSWRHLATFVLSLALFIAAGCGDLDVHPSKACDPHSGAACPADRCGEGTQGCEGSP